MTKAVVLGGGMGGLSAAFELASRGFQVEVYEKRPIFGGKARSFDYPNTGTSGRPNLPAEHGFRFFPGWYRHVTDTMARIPYTGPGGGAKVEDRLVEVPEIAYAMKGKPPFKILTGAPETLHEWIIALTSIFSSSELGVKQKDAEFFVFKLLCFLGSCEQRRLDVYENTSWFDYIEANRSDQYRKICATGLTRSLVATRAEVSSTYTVGTILTQMLYSLIRGDEIDRILDGPTSDVWIDPWVQHLTQTLGVTMTAGAEVKSFTFSGNQMTSAEIEFGGAQQTVTGDYFVCALPVEVTRQVMTQSQMTAAGIEGIKQLEIAWMNGVMYYTNRNVQMVGGHAIYVDSPWAVTSISQSQFWKPEFQLSQYGDGSVRDILSSIISEWEENGSEVFTQPAEDAPDRATIKDEIWEEMKVARTQAGSGAITDADLVDSILDPAITGVGSSATIKNEEPLLTNTVGSLKHRPAAQTAIANLTVAGDYVMTYTNLATMEAANEAGRRAANAILDAAGAAPGDRAGIWPFQEPHFFHFWKWLDEATYDKDNPGKPPICEALEVIFGGFGLFTSVLAERTGEEAYRLAHERILAKGKTGTAP